MFGGGGDSKKLKQIQTRLKQVLEATKVIEGKIDYLISAVGTLPAVIMREFDQKDADKAYGYLNAAYVVIRDGAARGLHVEPPMGVKADLLHAWTTVVMLESRPKLLLEIPFWTEFVRAVILLSADTTFAEFLTLKKAKIDALVEAEVQGLDVAFNEGHSILKSQEFASYAISGDSPYFSFVPAPVPQVIVGYRPSGPRDAERPIYGNDKKWVARRTAHESRLKELCEIINARRAEFNAQFSCQQMLTLYLPNLNRGGHLQPPSGWSGSQPEAILSLEA